VTMGDAHHPAPRRGLSSPTFARPPRSPLLTWRDMQHLVVRASKPAQLEAKDWRINGVGRQGAVGPGREWGAVPAGQVTVTLLCSKPPLWLWAAGCWAAGGPGSHVAAYTAAEEMRHPGCAHPHVREAPPQPSPVHTCHLPGPLLTPVIAQGRES
jgi:hypothetical protein